MVLVMYVCWTKDSLPFRYGHGYRWHRLPVASPRQVTVGASCGFAAASPVHSDLQRQSVILEKNARLKQISSARFHFSESPNNSCITSGSMVNYHALLRTTLPANISRLTLGFSNLVISQQEHGVKWDKCHRAMNRGQSFQLDKQWPYSPSQNWLVVYLPLWKIWVRQLGLLFPTYGKS